ncbi:Zinc metalloproteinase nas-14 [Anthophora retusa]
MKGEMLITLLIVTMAMIGADSKAIEPSVEEEVVPPTPRYRGKFSESYDYENIANRVSSWKKTDKENVWELSGLHEGDIMLADDDEDIGTQNGIVNTKYRWTDGVVPYYIKKEDFVDKDIEAIKGAMEEYHRDTCIRFRPYQKSDKHYIYIEAQKSGCWSYVGKLKDGQVVNLQNPGCLGHGTIAHELLHALGFYHQQSAADRDDWVTINWENIQPGKEHNFNKYDRNTVTDFGYSYDYSSVMHYGLYAFSKNSKPTITPKVSIANIISLQLVFQVRQ